MVLSLGIAIEYKALVLARFGGELLLDELLDVLILNAVVVLLQTLLDLIERLGVLLRLPTVVLFALLAVLDASRTALQLLHRLVDHLLEVDVVELVVAAKLLGDGRLADAGRSNDQHTQRLQPNQ